MNKTYKHIFFDLDRTLWDFEKNARAAFLDMEIEMNLTEAIPDIDTFIARYDHHNELLWDQYRKGLIQKPLLRTERFTRTLKDFDIHDEKLAKVMGERYLEIAPTKTHLMEGTVETLNYLKAKKYQMHIITNGFKEVQFIKLKSCGIDVYFDHVVTSDNVGYQKPKPEIFAFALNGRNAKKKESLMIGDDFDVDVVGARNYGVDQVYFDIGLRKEPVPFEATYTITQLTELQTIL